MNQMSDTIFKFQLVNYTQPYSSILRSQKGHFFVTPCTQLSNLIILQKREHKMNKKLLYICSYHNIDGELQTITHFQMDGMNS